MSRLLCVLSSMKLALSNALMAKVLLTFGGAGTVATPVVYERNTGPTIAPDSDRKTTPLMIVLQRTVNKPQAIRVIRMERNIRFASSSLTPPPMLGFRVPLLICSATFDVTSIDGEAHYCGLRVPYTSYYG